MRVCELEEQVVREALVVTAGAMLGYTYQSIEQLTSLQLKEGCMRPDVCAQQLHERDANLKVVVFGEVAKLRAARWRADERKHRRSAVRVLQRASEHVESRAARERLCGLQRGGAAHKECILLAREKLPAFFRLCVGYEGVCYSGVSR